MEIHYQQGISPGGENWLTANRVDICPARQWPNFQEIEPKPLLSSMAKQLFSLCDCQELALVAETLPYFAELAKKVERVNFNGVHLAGGKARDCHFDTCKIYKPGKHQYYAGFASLFNVDRFALQPHSWLMSGNLLIETTPMIRNSYFGIAMESREAAAHCEYITGGQVTLEA